VSGRVGAYLRQNVLGIVAIFIALSAGAYAVQKAPKNSVVSKSIKKGAVKSGDIGDGKVTSVDLADETITGADVLDESLSGADVGANSLGGADVDEATLSGVPGANGGTVTQVNAGVGLSGGPVTTTGTIRIAPCPVTQILKSTGPGYTCAADEDTTYGAAAGGGLIEQANEFLLRNDCNSGQVLKYDGNWECESDFFGRDADETASATPSVADGITLLRLNYGSATTVTDLTGEVNGQYLTLLALNANVTINDSGAFNLSATWTPTFGDTLTLVSSSGLWIEVARSVN
jgi:hypothetical protein